MIKRTLLLCSLMLGGCSAQPRTVFIADFENACGYPIEVTAHDYSNAKEPFVPNRKLATGEAVEVLSYIVFGDELENSVPDTYRLDIAANGKVLSLDKDRFVAQLGRSQRERKGNAITVWKISDTTLCP